MGGRGKPTAAGRRKKAGRDAWGIRNRSRTRRTAGWRLGSTAVMKASVWWCVPVLLLLLHASATWRPLQGQRARVRAPSLQESRREWMGPASSGQRPGCCLAVTINSSCPAMQGTDVGYPMSGDPWQRCAQRGRIRRRRIPPARRYCGMHQVRIQRSAASAERWAVEWLAERCSDKGQRTANDAGRRVVSRMEREPRIEK